MAAHFSMGRIGQIEQQAKAVVWLRSARPSFVIGVPPMVDGGLLAI